MTQFCFSRFLFWMRTSLSSIEEENNLGHILYIFISLSLGQVQIFCQILANERGFTELILYLNVTQIVLFLYWSKMTANWFIVSRVWVCEQFSSKNHYWVVQFLILIQEGNISMFLINSYKHPSHLWRHVLQSQILG